LTQQLQETPASGYHALLQNKLQVEAKNFVLHLGTTDEWSQWGSLLPLDV
jgi:hypothetical protein